MKEIITAPAAMLTVGAFPFGAMLDFCIPAIGCNPTAAPQQFEVGIFAPGNIVWITIEGEDLRTVVPFTPGYIANDGAPDGPEWRRDARENLAQALAMHHDDFLFSELSAWNFCTGVYLLLRADKLDKLPAMGRIPECFALALSVTLEDIDLDLDADDLQASADLDLTSWTLDEMIERATAKFYIARPGTPFEEN